MDPTLSHDHNHRALLQALARQAMLARGLLPDFSPAALAQLEAITGPAVPESDADGDLHDLRDLLWASIDNDDSEDLDQVTVAEALPGPTTRIYVAVADVDALVKKGSAIDMHAGQNTTSVYTAAEIFPMLPVRLSTDLTSLTPKGDRLAVVTEMIIGDDGALQTAQVYRALVRNHAKLAYNSVAAWLDGTGPEPDAIAAVPGLAENLRLQDRVARRMQRFRHIHGALSLQTIEAEPIFEGDEVRGLAAEERNCAKDIIEDFMIAANGVTARYLAGNGRASIRRVVRSPKRWPRIVDLAREYGASLPADPDARALEEFLIQRREADPLRFPDLSLTVIKLMGAGEYVAEMPGDTDPDHFGLAVRDYTHSTAPNRRYTDLVTQRLLKAALAGEPAPYDYDELSAIARQCTEQEDAADKVERQMGKSAAALLLASHIGEQYEAIVTGASYKGTWARLLAVPVEGKVVEGFRGLDVGDRTRVKLLSVDVNQGFIDFGRVGRSRR